MFICIINIYFRYGKDKLEKILEPLNMDMNTLITLLILDQAPGINQHTLNRFLYMDKGNLTKYIQDLEAENLIIRHTDAIDSRNKRCFLSPTSRKLIPSLQEKMQEWEDLCFHGFSPEERETYNILSEKIQMNILGDWAGEKHDAR